MRWKKPDLMSGASDLSVYDICKSNGVRFGINLTLHGKLYVIDDSNIFLGSSNLTSRGMGLCESHNLEFGTSIKPTLEDLEKINQLVENEVRWVDDDLFHTLKSEIAQADKNIDDWSVDISLAIDDNITHLWVADLLELTPSQLMSGNVMKVDSLHDLTILELNEQELTEEMMVSRFKKTKVYKWIYSKVKENSSVSFGLFSKLLHDALIDDPTPYRKEVKSFVRIIFEWIELSKDVFLITKYNRTSAVSFNG